MNFPNPVPVTEIANWIGAKLIGDKTLLATGINEIHKVRKGDITFVDIEKYFKKSISSSASIIILNEETECPPGKALLLTDKPFESYDNIVKRYRPFHPWVNTSDSSSNDIHPDAIIEDGVMIGKDVHIGENTYIQTGAIIRDHVRIGANVKILPNAVIGSDAFYFKKWSDHYEQWTTGGRVIIEDDVFIGAGTTIASGVSGDTIVGKGTKVDNLVQISHGVVIGKNCLIAAQAGIAGKTIIGDNCVIYGQAGIAQNLTIGPYSIISAQSGVPKDLEGGKIYFGTPVMEMNEKFREIAILRQIVKAWDKLRKRL